MPPVSHLNPETLPHNPAFTYAVRVDPPASTIYVGGQNGVGADGAVVEGGLGAQSAQARSRTSRPSSPRPAPRSSTS
jgi:hypothetical protein